MLRGRDRELAVVGGVAREGGAVVVLGDVGAGKTALLDAVAERTGEARVLRGAGVESEAALPYAGLQVVLREVAHLVTSLPERQREALTAAMDPGTRLGVERFLAGAGVLTLLGELAEDGPVAVLIDDAHWLDAESAEALLFAARRLGAERAGVVFAAREGSVFDRPGLPLLRLEALAGEDADKVLRHHAPHLPATTRKRLLKRAAGNPLALVELAADGVEDDGPLPASETVRRIYTERLAALPQATRTLLAVAAAEDTGDAGLVLRAAETLGARAGDLAPAEAAGLVRRDGGRLEFRHPLLRAAAYQAEPRTSTHTALAAATPDAARSAWHRAAATAGHDERLAAELDTHAERFRARGGRAAVAAAYRKAARLTADREARGRRLAAAALATGDAGDISHGIALAEEAAKLVTIPAERARIAEAIADLEYIRGRPVAARTLLVEAARWDPVPLRYFKAMLTAWDAPDPATALAATEAQLADLNLTGPLVAGAKGLRAFASGDLEAAVPALRELAAADEQRSLADRVLLQGWEMLLGEYAAVHERVLLLDATCRERGALGLLPKVLLRLAHCQFFLGRHHDAYATAMEGLGIARDTGCAHLAGTFDGLLGALAAMDGEEYTPESTRRGPVTNWHDYALGLLEVGRGRFTEAVSHFARIAEGPFANTVLGLHALPELVEAAVRVGRHDQAAKAAARFGVWARVSRTPWAHMVDLRCRALVSENPEPLFADALDAHAGDRYPFGLARTRLARGEWLRRVKRRGEAREDLTAALVFFESARTRPWADRTRAELRAAGTVPKTPVPVARLTAQETQVVRLAATGLTNREIGARLFISPRTVGYHLSNAYPKLGVTSRAALAGIPVI